MESLLSYCLKQAADPDAKECCVSPKSFGKWDYLPQYDRRFYGTLFQWTCARGRDEMVRAFLEHGVNIHKPIVSWANWYESRPIYVAWICGNINTVNLLLEYYEGVELIQLACNAIERRYSFLVKLPVENKGVKSQASWLLRKCLERLLWRT